jgi:hypothetical protein
MIDEIKLTDMIACFLQCDKPELVDYLRDIINFLHEIEDEDDYISDSGSDEELEVEVDSAGFYKLK